MSTSLIARLRSNQSLLRSVGVLGMAQAGAAALGIATAAVWARFMPVELFGEFRVALSIATFLASFCLQGTGQAATMSAAQAKDGNYWPLLRAKTIANLLGSLGLLAAAAYYYTAPSGGSPTLALGLVAAAICFPLYNCTEFWMAWLNGKGNIASLAQGRLVSSALGLCAVVVAAWLQLEALWIVLTIFLLLQVGQNAVMVVLELRQRRNEVRDQSLIAYGHHATFAMMFSSLLSLDVVLLNHVHDARAVAVYLLALQFPQQLKALFGVFAQALTPRIQKAADVPAAWHAARKPFWYITGFMVVVGFVGYYLLPPVMLLLFSERYAEAADHARLLWLSLALSGSATYLSSALLLTKRPIFVYVPIVGFAFLSLVLYGLLVPYGVAGMVWARIIASLVLSLFYVLGFLYCLREAGTSRDA